MAPSPNQSCPHAECGEPIRELLTEMVPNTDQSRPEFQKLLAQTPGGAITCPYCQQPVEYNFDGKSLVTSAGPALRYSRAKMERRASDYGCHKSPPVTAMTPEQWVAREKLMPGALRGYQYVEDVKP